MNKISSLFLSFFFLSLLVSCGKNTSDILIVGTSIDGVISLDPAEVFEVPGMEYLDNTYDTLVVPDLKESGKIETRIAESWTVSSDKKTIIFKIRPGIKFASNNPLTAHDVAFSLQRAVILQKNPSEIISQFGFTPENVKEKIRALDDYTLSFSMDDSYAETFVLQCLTSSVCSIVDEKETMKHQIDGDMGHQWLKTNYAGSGPFVLKIWKPKEFLIIDSNPHYFRGVPKIRSVVFQHVTDVSSSLLMLEKGDIDILKSDNLTSEQIRAPRKNVRVEKVAHGVTRYLLLNQKIPALQIPEVQQAIRHLIDYNGIIDSQLKGKAFVHQTFLPIGFFGAIEENPYEYNIEKARELLRKAGVLDKLSLTLETSNAEQGQALQASFSKGGIKLNINLGDSKQVLTKVRERHYELAISSWVPDYFDPHGNAATFAFNKDNADNSSSKTIMWRAAWESSEINHLTEEAKRESSANKRRNLYHLLQKKLLHSPIINMFQYDRVFLMRDNISGVEFINGSNKIFYEHARKA